MLLKKLQKKDTNNNNGHCNNENQCTHLNEINGVCKWNQFQKYCNAMSGNMQVTMDRWCANAYANNEPKCNAPFFWSFTSVLHACWLVSMVIQLNYTINAQIFLIVCLRKPKKLKMIFKKNGIKRVIQVVLQSHLAVDLNEMQIQELH